MIDKPTFSESSPIPETHSDAAEPTEEDGFSASTPPEYITAMPDEMWFDRMWQPWPEGVTETRYLLATPLREAAPDLLEACEYFLAINRAFPVKVGDNFGFSFLAKEMIAAAVAKAKGDAP